MSYSLSFQGTASELREATTDLAGHPNIVQIGEEFRAPSLEAATKAADVALDVVYSGLVGDPNGRFFLTLSGHANPDHKPREGWSNDSVTISIAQAGVPSE